METLIVGHTFTTIENCEDVWDSEQGANVTPSASTDCQVGTYSAAFIVAAGVGANALIATEDTASTLDLSACDYLAAWIYSSIDLAAGDLQILIDEHADCASPSESLDIPAITALTWTRVAMPFADVAASRNAIVSVGVKQVTDVGAFILGIDDVQAFVGKAYSVLSIRGLTEPDDIELNAAAPVKLLDGSYYANAVPSYNRNITVGFGPLSTKSDRIFLLTAWNKTVLRLIAQGDEATVCRTTEKFGNEWLEGLSIAKSFTMTFVEKTARTTNPSSFTSSDLSSVSTTIINVQGMAYHTGSGIPSASLGSNGDWYWDTVGLQAYMKIGGSWVQM